jgi:hypothetical protein
MTRSRKASTSVVHGKTRFEIDIQGGPWTRVTVRTKTKEMQSLWFRSDQKESLPLSGIHNMMFVTAWFVRKRWRLLLLVQVSRARAPIPGFSPFS